MEETDTSRDFSETGKPWEIQKNIIVKLKD